jgi:GTP-binding protein
MQTQWVAERGGNGGGRRKDGRKGSDLIIPVPLGTQVIEVETGNIIADITLHDQKVTIAKGGRGGKGNDFFKSATRQTPDFSQPGEEGEAREVLLSLKLLADIGIVGLPNAGKSTLISVISKARPKIADYPFTTLTPSLGVVQPFTGKSFVVADIPGLIEGASEGKGLGIAFLKHIERTAVLVHLIDVSAPTLLDDDDPEAVFKNYQTVRKELSAFSTESQDETKIDERPEIVVLSKTDIVDEDTLKRAIEPFISMGITPLTISSATGEGIRELVEEMAKQIFQSY